MKNLILSIMLSLVLSFSVMAVDITAPDETHNTNSVFTVPLTSDSTFGIIAFQFHLGFNPSLVKPTRCTTEGTILPESFSVYCNVPTSGQLYVSAYSAYPIQDEGIILNIDFSSGSSTGTSPLKFSEVQFYDESGLVDSIGHNGHLNIVQ